MGKLAGKVAIVTGASRGIGVAIAKHLAAAGAKVVVNYSTSRAAAEQVVADIHARDGKAIAVGGNMGVQEDVRRLFAETKKAFGPVDVLVNNAGIYKFDMVEEVTVDEFHRQFDVNVLGPLLATQEALRHFGPQGGSIVNISSVAARNAVPSSVVYSATKAALESMTQELARELAPRKVRVNAVAPGYTVTEAASATGFFDGESGQRIVASTPLGRFGQPEDIAPAVTFLASDDSSWITGEVLRVAGGVQ
jgi:3-oxoacyl-[acyl-carrier protein] reductase